MKSKIFLDFDGVLFDTIKEAYAIATISTQIFHTIDEVDYNSEHYKLFRKYRYLISPAWNYKYLLEAIIEYDIDKEVEQKYLLKINNVNKDDYSLFEKSFFQTRVFLKTNDFEKWLKLNKPFEFLTEIKSFLIKYPNLFYIVTTKDKETVSKLLEIENIFFNKNKIYDKDDYNKLGNKKHIIESIVDKRKQSIFIDDSLKHITDCSKIKNLDCMQPEWGYVSYDDNTDTKEYIVRQIKKLIEEKNV